MKVDVCQLALEFPEDAIRIPPLPGQAQIHTAAFEGLVRSIEDSRLDYRIYDLGKCLKLLLEHPEAAEQALREGYEALEPRSRRTAIIVLTLSTPWPAS